MKDNSKRNRKNLEKNTSTSSAKILWNYLYCLGFFLFLIFVMNDSIVLSNIKEKIIMENSFETYTKLMAWV